MRSDPFRLGLFIAAAFSVLGLYLPFWPAWLEERGLGSEQIGSLALAWAVTRGLASPLWAHFVDRSGHRRRWLVGIAFASTLAFVPFGFVPHEAGELFPLLVALTILFAGAHAALLPLGENLLLLQARERGLDYGRMRLWGSVSFVVASTIGGRLIADGHESRTWILLLGLLALGALVAPALPPDPVRELGPRARMPVASVLADRRVLAVLVGGGIVQASHAVYYVFSTLHWTAAGHSTDEIGLLWSEGVVAEALLFAAARPLVARLGPRGLLALALVGCTLRWSALALSTDLGVLFGVQWLHALTFSAAHLAVMTQLSRAVPASHSATAQSLYGTMNIAAHALTLLFATPIFHRAGAVAYWPMIGVALVGCAVASWGMATAHTEGGGNGARAEG